MSFLSFIVAPWEKYAVFADTKTSRRRTYGMEERNEDKAGGSE